MSNDQEKKEHWNDLASELGAEVPEESVGSTSPVESEATIDNEIIDKPMTTKRQPPRREKRDTNWGALADDLGIEVASSKDPSSVDDVLPVEEVVDQEESTGEFPLNELVVTEDTTSETCEHDAEKTAESAVANDVMNCSNPSFSKKSDDLLSHQEEQFSGFGTEEEVVTGEFNNEFSKGSGGPLSMDSHESTNEPVEILKFDLEGSETMDRPVESPLDKKVVIESAFDLSVFDDLVPNEQKPDADDGTQEVKKDKQGETSSRRGRRRGRRGRRSERSRSDETSRETTAESTSDQWNDDKNRVGERTVSVRFGDDEESFDIFDDDVADATVNDDLPTESQEEPEEPEEPKKSGGSEERTSRPRRRRRRRGRRSSEEKKDVAGEEQQISPAEINDRVDGELDVDDGELDVDDGELDSTQETVDSYGKVTHRKIPSWEEAVGMIVTANMESRAKSGRTGGFRGRGRGSGRGPGKGSKR